MDKLIAYAIAAASFFNAVKTIVDFYKERVKKPVDNVISRNIKQEIAPVTSELKEIKEDIQRLDKNQCKNYLIEFLEDMKKGVKKTDIEKKRASEVYDHYKNDLHLNSYIHDGWETYMKGEK